MAIDRKLETRLWSRWPASRDELCALYQPVVWKIANTIVRRLPKLATTCVDEIASAGQIGLLRALDRFDPTRRVRFTSYCGPRIRGAILDELRVLDHIPRRERERCRATGEIPPLILIQSDLPEQEIRDEPYVEFPLIDDAPPPPRNPDTFRRHLQHSFRRIANLLIVQERSIAETAIRMKRNQTFVRKLTRKLLDRLNDVFTRSGLSIWGERLRTPDEEDSCDGGGSSPFARMPASPSSFQRSE